MRKLTIIFLISTLIANGYGCRWTAKYFRKHTNYIFGITYPYQLFMAQAYVESGCKPSSISNDDVGSQGIGQITWRWWRHYLVKRGVPNLNTVDRQTKAQVLIMKRLYDKAEAKTGCSKVHWIPFQAYNGGWLVAKEIKRANSCEHDYAKLFCKRKVVHFKNGQTRKACDINYKYSEHIYNIAKRYYNYKDSYYYGWRFWQ